MHRKPVALFLHLHSGFEINNDNIIDICNSVILCDHWSFYFCLKVKPEIKTVK